MPGTIINQEVHLSPTLWERGNASLTPPIPGYIYAMAKHINFRSCDIHLTNEPTKLEFCKFIDCNFVGYHTPQINTYKCTFFNSKLPEGAYVCLKYPKDLTSSNEGHFFDLLKHYSGVRTLKLKQGEANYRCPILCMSEEQLEKIFDTVGDKTHVVYWAKYKPWPREEEDVPGYDWYVVPKDVAPFFAEKTVPNIIKYKGKEILTEIDPQYNHSYVRVKRVEE